LPYYGPVEPNLIQPPASTPSSALPRLERLEARLTARQKRLLQRAADLTGRSLSDFVISSAQEAALRAIRHHELVVLGAEDQRAFVQALLHPPAPSRRLRAAWRRYQQRTRR